MISWLLQILQMLCITSSSALTSSHDTMLTPGAQIVGLLADKDVPKIFATLLCDEGGLLWMGGYNPSATTSTPLYTPLDNTQVRSCISVLGLHLRRLGRAGFRLADFSLNFENCHWVSGCMLYAPLDNSLMGILSGVRACLLKVALARTGACVGCSLALLAERLISSQQPPEAGVLGGSSRR